MSMNPISSIIRLSAIFSQFPYPILTPIPIDLQVTGIKSDSRQVQPGDLFVAVAGGSVDGHRYIPEAVRKGAVAVVGDQPVGELSVPYIQVPDSRRALPYLAAGLYGYPARQMVMIGVTGTDGKTTTTNLIYAILRAAGLNAGMVSTINAQIGAQALDTGFHVTTPDPQDVQRYLAQMVAAGMTHAILETTSHGWDQHRVDACEFDLAVITNITHEHLDYHRTFEAYRAAKGRLFTSLSETVEKSCRSPRLAVLNRDDASYDYLSNLTQVKQISYGLGDGAEIRAEDIRYEPDCLCFTVLGLDNPLPVKTRLMGDYNISNCLGAIAATVAGLGLDPQAARQALAEFPGIPGRMERIDIGQDFLAYVDFAHTPNALSVTLKTARRLTQGRLIALFGSAGLRDRAKRRMMAEMGVDLADVVILTAEDPRTEPLAGILREMATGAVARGGLEGGSVWKIPDRVDAMRFAVALARPGDLVIACGKGHEQSMCFGTIEYPWDDRVALRAAIGERLGIPGMEMPMLPTREP